MKKIVIQLAILMLILYITDRSFGLLFSRYIASHSLSGECGGAFNYLLQEKRETDFLIMGSSRAKHQLDPHLLTRAGASGYNMGVNGVGSLLYNNVLLGLILQEGIKPHTLIMQADMQNFIEPHKDLQAELRYLLPYIDTDQSGLLRRYMASAGRIARIKTHSYMLRYNGQVLNILFNYFKRHKVAGHNGFEPLMGVMDSIHTPPPAGPPSGVQPWDSLALEAFRNIAAQCAPHQIKLIWVLPPSYKNKLYLPAHSQRLMAEISHLPGTSLIDLSDISRIPALSYPRYWKDETHLNAEGARLFSIAINEYLAAAPVAE